MRLVATFLLLIPLSLFSQKVDHENFGKIMRTEKVFLEPQSLKVDTLNRSEAKYQLNNQLAASLAYHLLNENRDSTLKLSITCPNLIYLTEGTIILYWDGDMKCFQGTFIQDHEHTVIQTISACSRVYSIQQPALSDKPESELSTGESHN